jgi:hypothetical protein
MKPSGIADPAPEADALGAVVVSGNQNHGDVALNYQVGKDSIEKGDRLRRGNRAVIDVAGDEDDVDLFLLRKRDQLVQNMLLVHEEGLSVKITAKMPICGMK